MTRKAHFIPPAHRGKFVHVCHKCKTIAVNMDHAVRVYRRDVSADASVDVVLNTILEATADALARKGITEADVLFFTDRQQSRMPIGMCRHNARLAGLKMMRIMS
jgi:hypothetical protein